jgi:hypothetical protein
MRMKILCLYGLFLTMGWAINRAMTLPPQETPPSACTWLMTQETWHTQTATVPAAATSRGSGAPPTASDDNPGAVRVPRSLMRREVVTCPGDGNPLRWSQDEPEGHP